METAGLLFTVIACEAAAEVQPFAVTVNVTVPEVETEIEGVVSVVLHVFPVEDDDVKFTDPPAQNVVDPPVVIVGVEGIAFTITDTGAEVAVQPDPFVSVTV